MRIAVYGASGFTGGLVAAELDRRGVEVVAVGRRGPVVAALDDPGALEAAFRGCDVVVSAVAPFAVHGEPVLRAAVAAGCHYVDTTGEQWFVKRVFDGFSGAAAEAGVAVVPAATDDGVPGDLVAHLVARELDRVDVLTVADLRSASGSASRGTARSMAAAGALLTDGALHYERGEWRTGLEVDGTGLADFGLSGSVPAPAGFGLTGPDPAPTGLGLVGSDPAPAGFGLVGFGLPGAITVPRHVAARRVQGVVPEDVAGAFTSLTSEVAEALSPVVDLEERRADEWRMAVFATSPGGHRAQGAVWGTDPYGTTARVAAEMALHLAKGDVRPGVLAAAQAVPAEDFLDRLGLRWEVRR
ncbi:saccharopine dehydrogenase NADP-binding domain-containing protein [Actinosynnema sp. NPDC059797]